MPTRKKYGFLFIVPIMLLLCTCKLNRTIVLFPLEPYLYEQNGVRFSIHEKQNYWIQVTAPYVPYKLGVDWQMTINSDQDVEFVLESVSLSIDDIGAVIAKQNIHLPLKDFRSDKTAQGFWTLVSTRNIIYTDDIRDALPQRLSPTELYGKFKNVKKVSFTLEFAYTINGEENSATIVWHYGARRETTSALWDALMSV